MQPSLILAAAETDGPLGVILPAAAELVYGTVAFLIVFLILKKFAFPRLNTMLDERTAAIQGRMEEAEAKLNEAEQAKRDYEASIADARGEAARIVDDAKAQAEQVRANLIAQAEEEAAAIRERARADAAAERERTLSELRAEVGRMSVDLASKIVGKELDASTHQALVDDYIQNLSRSN
jgi:F-type H+-transporting ATPase subunit b